MIVETLGVPITAFVLMKCDNKAATHITNNSVFYEQSIYVVCHIWGAN